MGRQQRSWTDEQLVDAVRASSTFKGVLRALGLKKGSTRYLQNHIEKAGLDTSHFHQASRANPRDEALKALVASDRTATEILTALGLPITAYHFNKVKRRLKLIGADASKFRRGPTSSRRWTSWSDDALRDAVSTSTNYAAVIRKLGLIPAGGNYDQVKRSYWRTGARYLALPWGDHVSRRRRPQRGSS